MKVGSIEGKRVIVTGGAGVIGCQLLQRLTSKGASVLSADRNPLPEGDWPRVTHITKNLAAGDLEELRRYQPDIIFHLAAAFERAKESPEFWPMNWQDNVILSHRIIDLAQKMTNLETFVFASSYLIYSPSLYLSPSLRDKPVYLKEDDAVVPRNICGAAKYYTERELQFTKEVSNPSLRVIFARIFRVYGYGSRDVISRWARAALSGQEIQVYNRQNRFDFIFAGDVAEGLLRLAESPEAEGVVNLGSGTARNIQAVLGLLAQHVPAFKSSIRDMGIAEPFEASCADLSRLKRLTGWTPPTSLEKGISTVIEFEKNKQSR